MEWTSPGLGCHVKQMALLPWDQGGTCPVGLGTRVAGRAKEGMDDLLLQ